MSPRLPSSSGLTACEPGEFGRYRMAQVWVLEDFFLFESDGDKADPGRPITYAANVLKLKILGCLGGRCQGYLARGRHHHFLFSLFFRFFFSFTFFFSLTFFSFTFFTFFHRFFTVFFSPFFCPPIFSVFSRFFSPFFSPFFSCFFFPSVFF